MMIADGYARPARSGNPAERGVRDLTSMRCSTDSGRVDRPTTMASRGDIETKSA
jgi:hypothetical protein